MAFKTLAFDSPAYSHVRQGQHSVEACGGRKNGAAETKCDARTNFLSRAGRSRAFPIE